MLTVRAAIATVERITYKPGWTIRAERGAALGHIDVTVSFMAPDATQRVRELIPIRATRGFDLHHIADEKHLVHVLFHHIQSAEQHELMEFFKVDGVPLFDPHKEIA